MPGSSINHRMRVLMDQHGFSREEAKAALSPDPLLPDKRAGVDLDKIERSDKIESSKIDRTRAESSTTHHFSPTKASHPPSLLGSTRVPQATLVQIQQASSEAGVANKEEDMDHDTHEAHEEEHPDEEDWVAVHLDRETGKVSTTEVKASRA